MNVNKTQLTWCKPGSKFSENSEFVRLEMRRAEFSISGFIKSEFRVRISLTCFLEQSPAEKHMSCNCTPPGVSVSLKGQRVWVCQLIKTLLKSSFTAVVVSAIIGHYLQAETHLKFSLKNIQTFSCKTDDDDEWCWLLMITLFPVTEAAVCDFISNSTRVQHVEPSVCCPVLWCNGAFSSLWLLVKVKLI